MDYRLPMTLLALVCCFVVGARPALGQEGAQAEVAPDPGGAAAGGGMGTAIVRVVTEPEFAGGGTFVFTGVPAGEIVLADDGRGSLTVDGMAAGSQVCKLSEMAPEVTAAGYALTEIRCDDQDSAEPSVGRLENSAAIFRLEASETVTCDFVLQQRDVEKAPMREVACICPKEGRWNVQNLEGSMECTGAFGFDRKLKPVRDNGVILVMEDDCSQLFGDSTTKKEDDVLMSRGDGCGYTGTFDGEEEGVDMVIDVVWTVESEERVTGEMSSTTSQMGITCDLHRPFELTFDEPLSDAEYQKWEKRIRKKMSQMK